MRFYQLEYFAKADQTSGPDGASTTPVTREWFGAERDAAVRRLELFRAGKLVGKKRDHLVWQVDVPTTKPELLAFLRKEVA